MKKALLDLSLEEFVRLICNKEKEYKYTINFIPVKEICNEPNEEKENITYEIAGKYKEIYALLIDMHSECPNSTSIKSAISDMERSLFDYDMELSMIDIYDYLEYKTKGFQKERCKIVYNEMELYHSLYICEERIEYVNKKIEEGWRDYKTKTVRIGAKHDDLVDYADAFNKLYGLAYDFFYSEAMFLLEQKIKDEGLAKKHGKKLPDELNNHIAKEVIKRAINRGLMDEDYNYTSDFTKAQRRRFAELASEELGIQNKWKVFESLWGDSNLAQYKIYDASFEKIKFIDSLFPKEIIDKCKLK